MKKLSLPFPSLAALAILISVSLAPCARAGSAVAGDHHGGYGYAYGPQSEKELRREAFRRCQRESRYPDDIEMTVSTASRGAGIILRYRVAGVRHIYAYVGADNARQAYEYAASGARDAGAEGPLEVVAKWQDD